MTSNKVSFGWMWFIGMKVIKKTPFQCYLEREEEKTGLVLCIFLSYACDFEN